VVILGSSDVVLVPVCAVAAHAGPVDHTGWSVAAHVNHMS
jgi:hypothetical protein